jgi:hypothetical protein
VICQHTQSRWHYFRIAIQTENGHFPEAFLQRSSATLTPLPRGIEHDQRIDRSGCLTGMRVIFGSAARAVVLHAVELQSNTGADCSGEVTPGSNSMILMLRK